MTLDQIRWLDAFNRWANARYLERIRLLTDEQLTRTVESSFCSVLATLSHVILAEWIWLRRWQGDSPTVGPAWMKQPTLELLETVLAEVEAERQAFFSTLPPEQLAEDVHYTLGDGTAGSLRLDSLVLHVFNHATYHRGQLATLLRQVGATPPATDLLDFAEGHPR